jgi:non-heme chloroperoxidase
MQAGAVQPIMSTLIASERPLAGEEPVNRATLLLKLALLGIAVSYLAPLSAHAQHFQPTGTKSGFVTTPDGVRIHYLEAGPRSSAAKTPAILFVPGWTMPAEIWEPQIAYFATTHRVIAMDPRSQGQSSQVAEGHYPEARARDIKAVVDQLKLAPAVLVGWSMGVAELAAYVDQFGCDSVAGLVLVDGHAGWDIDPPLLRRFFDFAMGFERNRREAAAAFVREMYSKPQSRDYLDRITRASLRTPTNTAMALLLAMVSTDRRSGLAKINKPTLIVVAQGPYQMIFEDMQRRIAGSQLKVMDGVGHALFVDDPQRFNSLLEDFLRTLEAAK